LNTAPLIWSYINGSRRRAVELMTDAAPARCADLLAHGRVEAALVPVIEYHRIPEIAIVPDVCVGSRGRVRSVVVATRGMDLEDARTIALDTSSRTSVALVQILFREFFGREPELRRQAPDLDAMLAVADAALVIGDPAMTFPRARSLRIYDLATLWREHTGLGFVFAMWMARVDVPAETIGAVDFAGARAEGLDHLDEITAQYAAALNLPRAELYEYLTDNICFETNEEMRAGLDLFYQLAFKHRIISELRPLRMVTSGGA
jgi:chorismate dehydratase